MIFAAHHKSVVISKGGGQRTNFGRPLQIGGKLEGGVGGTIKGVGEPTSADRPESGVSNEGEGEGGGVGNSTFVDPVRI